MSEGGNGSLVVQTDAIQCKPFKAVTGMKDTRAPSVLLVDPPHCCLIVPLILNVVVVIRSDDGQGGSREATVSSTRSRWQIYLLVFWGDHWECKVVGIVGHYTRGPPLRPTARSALGKDRKSTHKTSGDNRQMTVGAGEDFFRPYAVLVRSIAGMLLSLIHI